MVDLSCYHHRSSSHEILVGFALPIRIGGNAARCAGKSPAVFAIQAPPSGIQEVAAQPGGIVTAIGTGAFHAATAEGAPSIESALTVMSTPHGEQF
jgi:hypothetical protein